MDNLAIHLALHGILVITVSVIGGLFLYRSILRETNPEHWHLLHAGGTSRGIMLIALAAIINLPDLKPILLTTSTWSIIYFVWTSVLAMLIRAMTGELGFGWKGTLTNKLVYFLYLTGTISLFLGLAVLIYGFFNAILA